MYYIHHKMYISTSEVNQYIISSILRHGFNVALPVPPPFLFAGTVTTTCRSYVVDTSFASRRPVCREDVSRHRRGSRRRASEREVGRGVWKLIYVQANVTVTERGGC